MEYETKVLPKSNTKNGCMALSQQPSTSKFYGMEILSIYNLKMIKLFIKRVIPEFGY